MNHKQAELHLRNTRVSNKELDMRALWGCGDLGICDAPKAGGPSPHLGCVFVQRRQKRRLARTEGPSRCFGCGSFVEEIGSSDEACMAEPTSPFLVASDQKRQILAIVVSP